MCLYSSTAFYRRVAGTLAAAVVLAANSLSAQPDNREPFGRTFNAGMGPGYIGTVVLPSPFFIINYEYDLFRNATIAPFLGLASYSSGPHPYAGKNYFYRATILPMGLKATYNLDRLLRIPCRWDVYLACSAGYAYSERRWDLGYPGSKGTVAEVTQLYLHGHVGAEYHITRGTGLFADVSTSAAVAGFAFHRY